MKKAAAQKPAESNKTRTTTQSATRKSQHRPSAQKSKRGISDLAQDGFITQLNDERFTLPQRQEMAVQLSQIYGNQTLQRAVGQPSGAAQARQTGLHPVTASVIQTNTVGNSSVQQAAPTFTQDGERQRDALGDKLSALDEEVNLARSISPDPERADWDTGINLLWDSFKHATSDTSLSEVEKGFARLENDIEESNSAKLTALDSDSFALLGQIIAAELASKHMGATRRSQWLNTVADFRMTSLQAAEMAEVKALVKAAKAERDFKKIQQGIHDHAIAAAGEWLTLQEQAQVEIIRLGEGASPAGLYAFAELANKYTETNNLIQAVSLDMVTQDDFLPLKSMIESQSYLWLGELRAARERVAQVMEMLESVEEIKYAGEDADALAPGWDKRAEAEVERLQSLGDFNPPAEYQRYFSEMSARITEGIRKADDAKPREKGILEKAGLFGIGAIKSVVKPFAEAAKQAVDLVKIYGHLVSKDMNTVFGTPVYEPELNSDMAKAAEQGMDTGDLLKGMVMGVIETPERLYKAMKKGDWEAIGEETANLYMLVKSGKQSWGKAKQILRWARARTVAEAGLRGGMDAQAAFRVRKLAMQDKKIIEFRPVNKDVVRLRELGHPAKPEQLKMKTIKEIDLQLGADPKELGMVGFFKPKRPPHFENLPLEMQERVMQQYGKRLAEFEKYSKEVAQLEANGVITRKGNAIADSHGKEFTGDYDLFDVIEVSGESAPGDYWRKMANRKNAKDAQLSGEPEAMTDLKQTGNPVDTQHGAHAWYNPSEAGFYADIVMEYRKAGGNQDLLRFNPDGSIEYSKFND